MLTNRTRVRTMWMFLLAVLCAAAASAAPSDPELAVGKAQEGTLSLGKTAAYELSLNAADFAEISVDPHGAELLAIAYGPSGNKLRGSRFGPDEDKFSFIAEGPGRYHVELSIAPDDGTKDTQYTIKLLKTVSLADRLADPPPKTESPRIKQLRVAVENGQSAAVSAFWDEMKKKGTPLIERLPDDPKNMLVTFLWQGAPDTKNVAVLWFPFTEQWPDDYRMKRLTNTDVWYATVKTDKTKRFIYRLVPNAPAVRSGRGVPEDLFSLVWTASQTDPLNPMHWNASPDDPDPSQYQGFSAVEMPDAPPQPWLEQRKGVPEGKIEKHQFSSALLKNQREAAVYLPRGYAKTAKPYSLLVLFDEDAYLGDKKHGIVVPTPTILDNLIYEDRIPPTVAVLIDNPPGARSRELPCNPTFADFLNFELVPWIRRQYNVTTDPHQIVVAGSSYGGLASTYAALRHPETFGNVLSQSGSYWWTPPKSGTSEFDPDAEPNWVAKQFIASPKLPIKFYLDAGSDEVDLSGRGSAILIPNRHLRDVLLAKGYEVHYQEFNGGHDYLSWRGTLADGLILLLGSTPAELPHETTQPPREPAHGATPKP